MRASRQLDDGWTGDIYYEWNFHKEIVEQWNRIASQYGDNGIFINYSWFDCWWKAFGDGKKPFVVVLQKDNEIKAVFPLYTDGDHLSSMTNSHTCHYDFIVDSEMRSEAISHLLHILQQGTRWKRVSLECTDESGENRQSLIRRLQISKAPFHIYSQPWAPWMEMPRDWENYVESLPGRLKNGIRRCIKKAEAKGRLQIEIIENSERIDDLLDIFFDLEFKNWKGRAGTAIRCEPEAGNFYRLLGHRAMQEGNLFLVLLRWNDSPIAASLCLKYGKTIFLLKPGYDEEFSYLSPGNVLQFKCLKSIFEKSDVSFYNFLGACDAWKMEWTSHFNRYGYIKVYPKSLGGWVAYSSKYGWRDLLKRSSMIRRAQSWLYALTEMKNVH